MVNVRSPGVSLVIKMGQKIYIVNTSDAEVKLKRGMIVCSFGKGKFKAKENIDDDVSGILYEFKSNAEEVPI